MRQRVMPLVCCAALLMPAAGRAQTSTQPPASPAAPAAPAPAPAPAAPATQVPEQPAAAAEAERDAPRGLFELAPTQFEFAGRLTSVAGDPARFQRYQDLRDGALFTDARYAHDDPGGRWLFRAAADNVLWRDQRFAAEYERTGRFVITGLWDEIPQFYSVDTRTPYTSTDSPLPLDDATQLRIQNGQANLTAYVPLASRFELQERRDIGQVTVLATPRPTVDVTASFTTTRHVGELPWGASFGFNNDVEVALPYDSRTNDFTVGAEWTNGRQMFRLAYNGSWFDNLDDTLVWDSPLRLDDAASAPGRGRMALWPSNSAQTVSAAGYAKFARRTQVTGFVSYGAWNNDEPLQPFTINTALPPLALPRESTGAEARVFSTNLNLVSRPVEDWRFSARVRRYEYDNRMGIVPIPQFINFDTSVATSSTGGPRPHAHDRMTVDADATWTGIPLLGVTVGYTRNNNGYAYRIFEDTVEDVLRVTADAVGSSWITFRAQYELGDRTGSGFDEALLAEVGEQPALRHYDVANRTRNRFTGQIDVMPGDAWTFSGTASVGRDEYDESYFGLQESTFRLYSIAADVRRPNGAGAGASYSFERYYGAQQSRSANPGQEMDPLRDWRVDSTERVNYVSIYLTPPRIGPNTEARLSYDYSFAKGSYLYAIAPGGPLTPPSQLPDVYNKLQQLRVDVRHRLARRLAATISYLYEPFRVYDFALDPSVVDGIVQPSSLVLGYVYRPYTAHAASAGIRYFW